MMWRLVVVRDPHVREADRGFDMSITATMLLLMLLLFGYRKRQQNYCLGRKSDGLIGVYGKNRVDGRGKSNSIGSSKVDLKKGVSRELNTAQHQPGRMLRPRMKSPQWHRHEYSLLKLQYLGTHGATHIFGSSAVN